MLAFKYDRFGKTKHLVPFAGLFTLASIFFVAPDAVAQSCASGQKLCDGNYCIPNSGTCCGYGSGRYCSSQFPVCCGAGTGECGATSADCNGGSSGGNCGAGEKSCQDGCIPSSATCCGYENAYCDAEYPVCCGAGSGKCGFTQSDCDGGSSSSGSGSGSSTGSGSSGSGLGPYGQCASAPLTSECPTVEACCDASSCHYEADGKQFPCNGVDCAAAAQRVVDHCEDVYGGGCSIAPAGDHRPTGGALALALGAAVALERRRRRRG